MERKLGWSRCSASGMDGCAPGWPPGCYAMPHASRRVLSIALSTLPCLVLSRLVLSVLVGLHLTTRRTSPRISLALSCYLHVEGPLTDRPAIVLPPTFPVAPANSLRSPSVCTADFTHARHRRLNTIPLDICQPVDDSNLFV